MSQWSRAIESCEMRYTADHLRAEIAADDVPAERQRQAAGALVPPTRRGRRLSSTPRRQYVSAALRESAGPRYPDRRARLRGSDRTASAVCFTSGLNICSARNAVVNGPGIATVTSSSDVGPSLRDDDGAVIVAHAGSSAAAAGICRSGARRHGTTPRSLPLALEGRLVESRYSASRCVNSIPSFATLPLDKRLVAA